MVAIVGRPNVGKSTLFNRLLKRRQAIEDDQPGVTRDRISADLEWNGYSFTLVDTGGLLTREQEGIEGLVSLAAEEAIRQADKVVFVVDGRVEPTDFDVTVARRIQKTRVPVILAVTKIDNPEREPDAASYYSLGLGDPMAVSGSSGLNTGDLLDNIVDGLPKHVVDDSEEEEVRLAVIGRPNVGKSSLVNRLIGQERQIVSDVPGTTRDAIDHSMRYKNRVLCLVDTAGLRRKSELRSAEAVDYYTALRTIRAINRSDVAAVLLDAPDGLTQWDRRLLDDVRNKGKGLIIVVNKWDLIAKDNSTLPAFERELRRQLPDLAFAPVLFSSALTGQRTRKLLDMTLEVFDSRRSRISTAKLNQFIERVIAEKPPPAVKGRWLKIKYASQVAASPPLFACFLNDPVLMPEAYRRFLERRIREEYGFVGVPLRVVFRKK